MSVHIKICGITDLAAAHAAVDAGADSLGFVLASSVRQITPEKASEIAAELPEHVDKVAVFRGPPRQDLLGALEGFDADVVQADFLSLEGISKPLPLPVFRETLTSPKEIVAVVGGGRFVYEGPHSGVGRAVDWELASVVAESGQMTLAGGLNPDNVAEAIRTVGPFGVDVSSGVESGPGVKDPTLISAFVQAVREAEKDLVKV